MPVVCFQSCAEVAAVGVGGDSGGRQPGGDGPYAGGGALFPTVGRRVSYGWAPVPSEAQLVQEYGIARGTARRAIEVVGDEGLVITVQGQGT